MVRAAEDVRLRWSTSLPALCLTLLGFVSGVRGQPAPLSAQEAWIRAVPGSDVAAAYLTLRNNAAQALVITGVRSPVAQQAMIHESRVVGGRSTMRPREPLRIAAGETVRFAPDGLHIMLMGLRSKLTPGEQVPLTLELEGGLSVTVTAQVRALGSD
jgi:periplasmic copper chaperone A